MKRVLINAPDRLTLDGFVPGPELRVVKGVKAPAVRFKPGIFLRYKKQLYEVLYAYRLEKSPSEWFYCLEERTRLDGVMDDLGRAALSLGLGNSTPRVIYDLFETTWDAWTYFSDIPANGDRYHASNKDLVQGAEVVSSGQVMKVTRR